MDTKRVTIEQVKEGFWVTDQDEERYAVISLFSWLEQHFDISEPNQQPKPESSIPPLLPLRPEELPLRPEDLKIAPFDYDKEKMQKYQSIFFQELPDGRTVLKYLNSQYYTSKIAVMELPYPAPKGYFSKENGWSSSVELAFKKYRKFLAEQDTKETTDNDPDRIYKPFGLSSRTQPDRDQEYTKIGDI